MTAYQHNKVIGVLHLVYGGISALSVIVLLVLLGILLANSIGLAEGLMLVILISILLFSIPPLLAGYAFLKRKRWAKIAGVVAAIVAGMNFPFGSALCVYTLWFLFGDKGKFLYHEATYALPATTPVWDPAARRERQREYVPPSAPPDWR